MTPQARQIWAGLEFRRPAVLNLIKPLTAQQMLWRPALGRNSVAWQLWHIAEVEDNWVRDRMLNEEMRYPFGPSVRDAEPEQYPEKVELISYFREVRQLSRSRLQSQREADFERETVDDHFGRLSVADLWAGLVTSFAWHGGQIALTIRLMNGPARTPEES